MFLYTKYSTFICLNSIYPFDLQVASDAKGRGVLRLLLLQQRFNLFSIAALCLQLITLLFPSTKCSSMLCFSYEIFTIVGIVHRIISSLAIALGRYNKLLLKIWKKYNIAPFQAILPLARRHQVDQRRNFIQLLDMDLSCFIWVKGINVG